MPDLTDDQLLADARRLSDRLHDERERRIGARLDVSGLTLHCTVLDLLIERVGRRARRPRAARIPRPTPLLSPEPREDAHA